MEELETIKQVYGEQKATRSQIPLINHIYEGLLILDVLDASDKAKRAFCIHPIVQNNQLVDVSWSDALELAIEYKEKANSYLCNPVTDWVKTIDDIKKCVGGMSQDCRLMLIADKYQNRKDFNIYHKATHQRSQQLSAYFDLWIEYLENHF